MAIDTSALIDETRSQIDVDEIGKLQMQTPNPAADNDLNELVMNEMWWCRFIFFKSPGCNCK